MQNEITKYETQPNYESEYYKHIELIKKLEDENTKLRETIIGMCNALFLERGF